MSIQKELNLRLGKIHKLLNDENLNALLISSVPNVSYLTGYLNFSIQEREAFLLITKKDLFIFTDSRYAEAVEKEVPHFKLINVTQNAPHTKIILEIAKKLNL